MAKCKSNKCKNKAIKNRTICHKCTTRRYAEKHPVRYAYKVLKNNAKRRKKEFDLTFEQFEQFVIKTGYMSGKGIYKESLHIDRIEQTKGYTVDNLQILTNSNNIKKYLRWNHDRKGKPIDFKFVTYIDEVNDDDPF